MRQTWLHCDGDNPQTKANFALKRGAAVTAVVDIEAGIAMLALMPPTAVTLLHRGDLRL